MTESQNMREQKNTKQQEMVAKIMAGRSDVEFRRGSKGNAVTLNGKGELPWPEITVGPQGGVTIWVRSYDESKKSACEWALEADQLLAKQVARDAKKAGIRKESEHCQKRVPAPAHFVAGDRSEARDRLAVVLKDLACLPKCEEKIEELKNDASTLNDPAFVWRSLIESLSGWGSSAGYERLIRHENYHKLNFDCLSKLPPTDQSTEIKTLFRSAGVRYWQKKPTFLVDSLTKIQKMGGLKEARTKLLDRPTRDDKIRFLRQFKGIGPKFARNILMNVYHDQFRQSIAVDDRIRSISKELGLSFRSYEDEEQFYLDVAKKAVLDGWDVDRLIYNFRDDVLARLRRDHPKSLKYA